MSNLVSSKTTTRNFFFYSFGSSILIVALIGIILNGTAFFIPDSNAATSYFYALNLVMAMTSAFLSYISNITSNSSSRTDYKTWLALLLFFLPLNEMSKELNHIDNQVYLYVSFGVQSCLIWALMNILVQHLKIEKVWRNWTCLLGTALFVLSMKASENVNILEIQSFNHIGTFRNLISIGVFLGLIILTGFHPSLRLDPESSLNSINLRLKNSNKKDLKVFLLLLSTLGLDQVLFSAHTQLTPGSKILSGVSLLWIPLFFNSWYKIEDFFYHQYRVDLIKALTPIPIRRFIFRHNQSNSQNWAATIGLKSTEFYIDHDTGRILEDNLPITISQIRTEEIKKCIKNIFGRYILNQEILGTRIHGSIDPESTYNPCVESLKFYSCLYLEVTALVEKRLLGLVTLLPLVDPELAKTLNEKVISSLARRNQWFLYLDYNWIDQILTKDPVEAKYRVRLNHLDQNIKNLMNEWAKENNQTNHIWLSKTAAERLHKEAPMLHTILSEVRFQNKLFYLVKLEELVPRLQNYFSLDKMRTSIQDFKPSDEAARIYILLAKRIETSTEVKELIETANAVLSYPWYGFTEKDKALQLVLKVWEKVQLISEPDSKKQITVKSKLLEIVSKIGYPSQFIHIAQIDKITLRDVNIITDIAKKPHDKRFEEAWLILSSKDYSWSKPEEIQKVMNLLQLAIHQPLLIKNLFVSTRIIDTLMEVGLVAWEKYQETITEIYSELLNEFILHEEKESYISSLLDRIHFLEQKLDTKIQLNHKTMESLKIYIDHLELHHSRENTEQWDELAALQTRVNF